MAALSPAFSATTIKMCLNTFDKEATSSYRVKSYSGSNYIWNKTIQQYSNGNYFGLPISVIGIGMCFTLASQVQIGTSPDTLHCWCKTIRPEITDWEYVQSYGDNKTCAAQCPRRCAEEYYVF